MELTELGDTESEQKNKCQDVMIKDVIDEDKDQILRVEGVGAMVARFIALEEEGCTPVWVPDAEEEGDQEDSPEQLNIEEFTARMQRFHNEEVARERERRKHNDYSGGYSKNSTKTLLWQKKARDEYAVASGKFISAFFPRKKRKSENRVSLEDKPDVDAGSSHEAEVIRISEDTNEMDDQIIHHENGIQIHDEPTLLTESILPQPIKPLAEKESPLAQPPSDHSKLTLADVQQHLEQLKANVSAVAEKLQELEAAEKALNQLTWKDHSALHKAVEGLMKKVKEKKLDVFLHGQDYCHGFNHQLLS
uniref:Uncharacterized protein n=1 Tax=Moniliophthora roreri TaxID=221103 RepID=A0A0W0FFN4_MONRR